MFERENDVAFPTVWITTPARDDEQPVTQGAESQYSPDGRCTGIIMKFSHIVWVICSAFAIVLAAPKPPGETAEHGNKDIGDVEEGRRDRLTTQQPEGSPMTGDISVEIPDNWDQPKEDSQSLFLNKSDKNDLEPYPMAFTDDAYDGQPIRADAEAPKARARAGALEHVIMRAELYGEPPSADPARLALRRKRANAHPLRFDLGTTLSRVSRMSPRYSTINRFKRESNMRSEDILALLSLWEDQQRRNNEAASSNYSPDGYFNSQMKQYYSMPDAFEDNNAEDRDDSDEGWMDEPIIPSHFSRPYYAARPLPIQPKNHYQYTHDLSDIIPPEPAYLQNLEALRRKRQWQGFGNRNHISKRFMVAKKRSAMNRPHEDLYSLSELLRSSPNREQAFPVTRRMIL